MSCQTVRSTHTLPAARAASHSAFAPVFELVSRLLRRPRLPLLRLDELSAHRRRDLGLQDGR